MYYIVILSSIANAQFQDLASKKAIPIHVQRWYNLIQSQSSVASTLNGLSVDQKAALTRSVKNRVSVEPSEVTSTGRAREGKFIELPGAKMGEVVVRFPPEASG